MMYGSPSPNWSACACFASCTLLSEKTRRDDVLFPQFNELPILINMSYHFMLHFQLYGLFLSQQQASCASSFSQSDVSVNLYFSPPIEQAEDISSVHPPRVHRSRPLKISRGRTARQEPASHYIYGNSPPTEGKSDHAFFTRKKTSAERDKDILLYRCQTE